jgi:hypothetical protein
MLQLLLGFILSVFGVSASFSWIVFNIIASASKAGVSKGLQELISAHAKVSDLGVLMRTSLRTAIACFLMYFWLVYIHGDRACDSYIFLFAKVSIYGPARRFFQFITLMYLLKNVLSIVASSSDYSARSIIAARRSRKEGAANHSFLVKLQAAPSLLWAEYIKSSMPIPGLGLERCGV